MHFQGHIKSLDPAQLPCVSIKTRAIPYRKPEPFEVHWLGGCAGLWAAPVPLKSNCELRVWLGQWQTETVVDWFGLEEGERWQINLLSLDSDLRQWGEGRTSGLFLQTAPVVGYFAINEVMLFNCTCSVRIVSTYFHNYAIWFDLPL